MSDGNFNRNLLPYHNYTSGVRAGRASALQRAMQILSSLLEEDGVMPDKKTREALLSEFHKRMTARP